MNRKCNMSFRFYAYKLPATYNYANRRDRGLAFLYITSKSNDFKLWSLSEKNIDDVDSVIGRTVSQSYVDNVGLSLRLLI